MKLDSVVNSILDGNAIITHDWFDSDKAVEIAEENGGKTFRNENPEYIIEASLSEPLVPNTSTIWYIEYRSIVNASNNLLLGIDANTGEVVQNIPNR